MGDIRTELTVFTSGLNSRASNVDKEWRRSLKGEEFKVDFFSLSKNFVLSRQDMPHTYSPKNPPIIPPLSISICLSFWGLSTLGWGHASIFPWGGGIWVDGCHSSAQMRREQYFLGDVFPSAVAPGGRRHQEHVGLKLKWSQKSLLLETEHIYMTSCSFGAGRSFTYTANSRLLKETRLRHEITQCMYMCCRPLKTAAGR